MFFNSYNEKSLEIGVKLSQCSKAEVNIQMYEDSEKMP